MDDGSVLSVEGMAQLFNEYGHSPEFTGEHGFARMNQLYAEWSKVPTLNGGSWLEWLGLRRNGLAGGDPDAVSSVQ